MRVKGKTRMTVFEFLPYAIALGIAAAIPGPGLAACVGKALGGGFRPALHFVNGLVLGDLTYLTLAILGLSALASAFSEVFTLVKWAGAAYLLYLAWSFWRGGIDPARLTAQRGDGALASLAGGYAVTLGNPKTIVFYMALLPSVVDLHAISAGRYLVLVAVTVVVLYAVVLPYIAAASRARVFLTDPRALRVLGRGAATAMAGAAAAIVARQ